MSLKANKTFEHLQQSGMIFLYKMFPKATQSCYKMLQDKIVGPPICYKCRYL